MPQLDPASFASQIFWLIVTFGFLYFLMARIILPRIADVMEERQDKVDDDLSRAERLKTEADEVMAEYEKALAEARTAAAAQLKEAGDAIAAETTVRQDAFGKQLAEKTAEAEQRIAAAQAEAAANLRQVAAEAAQAITGKLVGLSPSQEALDKAIGEATGGRS